MSANTNLGNTPVNQGYVQLFHTGETGGVDTTLRQMFDGDGTASDLYIASNAVKIGTTLYIGSDTLAEYIQDTVGAMFSGNTETNITVTYQDSDGTIDLVSSGEVTLTGSETLSNKTLAAPTLTGTTQGASITLSGDLTVNGTTTTVNQTNLDVSDNIIGLNRGSGSNANDSGLIIERGSTGDNAAIIWDESADKFTLGTTTSTPSATGDLTISTGTLVANLEGNVSGNLTTDSVTISTIQTGSESFADNDTSLMTSAAIQDKITSYGYVTSSGISHDGSTANGVLTYKDADEATVESNLTFNGNKLNIESSENVVLAMDSTSTYTFLDLYNDNDNRVQVGNANDGDFIVRTADAIRLIVDSSGNTGIINELYHYGDTDTKMAFTADAITFTAGGETLLTLTESSQDVVKLGDGGDVDINLNDDMFIEGSYSNVGI